MLNIIVKAIFTIVGKIGDIVLAPLMLLINGLVPNFSSYFPAIFTFLQNGFNYIKFFCSLLMIPPFCINLVITVFTLSLTLIVGIRTYQFIMKIYNYFKP